MALFIRFLLFMLVFTVPQFNRYMIKSREARERYEERLQTEERNENATPNPRLSVEINNNKRPEVWQVILADEGSKNDLGKAWIRDVYENDYMSSGVVGLVGVPVSVTYENDQAEPRLTFYYQEKELRGIPERNLIILHEMKDTFYEQVGVESIDEAGNTISVKITEPGTYLMADRYQWYSCWGVDVSEYAYEVDVTAYASDWERECDTGSIMELADKKWAMENAPEFHVSTPEQLASVVYYNNAIANYATDSPNMFVYLENDIDLAGYDWVPMGWNGSGNNRFDGVFDGQGHVIRNMTIDQPKMSHVAFIGYSTGVLVKNVTFENAFVNGGSYTGIVGGEIYISPEWENVHVDGVISGARGEVGSIIGREAALHFKDCSANVMRQNPGGETYPLEYFSHRLEVIANTLVTEDFTLAYDKNGCVTRTTSDKEFRNLCWHLEADGVQILQRGADDETVFNAKGFFENYPEAKERKIWLEAYTGETYTRVSNVLEYPNK
ncbi:MAG: hypothetical protein IK081_09275 [Lachnospiraceae bacterium]|nr:hypothetical protein [Lachnospiraceae bacterium]